MNSFLVLTLLAAITSGCSVGADPNLQEVCANRQEDSSIGFSNVNNVLEVIAEFEKNPDACNSLFHNSLRALSRVLDERLMQDVCGLPMYEAIRNYHENYISPYVPETDKWDLTARLHAGTLPIPKALRDFFIVFVDSISAECKKQMTDRLNLEMANKINNDEYHMMIRMEDDSERVLGSEYYQKPKSFSDVYVEPNPVHDNEKLFIQVRFNDILMKAKAACTKKFKPIYDELFTPVIRLNNLGYWDKLSSADNFKLNWMKKYTRWLSIVQICETMEDIEVIVDNSHEAIAADLLLASRKDSQPKEVKRIRILTRDQAAELVEEIAKKIERQSSTGAVEKLEYNPEQIKVDHHRVSLGSQLLTGKPEQRAYLVKRFDKKIKGYMSKKLNPVASISNRIFTSMKTTMHKWRHQIIDKDQETVLGKVSNFMEKYRRAGGGLVVTAMMFALK